MEDGSPWARGGIGAISGQEGLKLGFACAWDPDPRMTWSGTPWNLRQALRSRTHVVDLGISLPALPRSALKILHARRRNGQLVSAWKHSALWSAICQSAIRGKVRRAGPDAVLEIQDLAVVDVPFFIYQDASYDVLLHVWDQSAGQVSHFPMLDLEAVRRRRERQHGVYERAAGLLAMSAWFARTLVEWTGMPPARVHVVHPGASALALSPGHAAPRRDPPRRRLLLIGKDFRTKGGDVVVRALAALRREYDPSVTLTVAGPLAWPLPGTVPEGVRFLGRVPTGEVVHLYDTHDLFVMPSRFEGFGIAFVEALARGLPCIGRDAFAMPELISPGHNGDLVKGDDPDQLAAAIVRVLRDDEIYRRCDEEALRVSAYFSWERAATDALAAIQGTLTHAHQIPAYRR